MSKLLLGSLAGLALIAAGAARAADMPAAPILKAPPPPITDWSGFYIGGHAGFAASSIPFTFTDDTGAPEDLRFSTSSYIAGGQLGAQWQYDQWVLGFEGTWSGLNLSQTRASTVTAGEFTSVKLNELATATVRFGSTWDRALFYAKFGYATARLNIHSVDMGAGLVADHTAWRGGWTAGAGVDWMLLGNFIIGAEFDYYNFNFDNTNGVYNDGVTPFSASASNGNIYAIMARASYLFR
jgi:outer membrane immunogenic protein